MRPKTFLNISLLLGVTLALVSHAETATTWIPARILGAIYPQEAKFARIEGIVEAKCSIRPNGSVADVTILSGHPVLARSVKTNLLQWTFRLADSASKPGLEALVVYSFQLKGSCDNHKGCKEQFWFEYPGQVTVISELPRINTK
jgi:hypothetical protein